MECNGDGNSKVVDSFSDDHVTGSALNASILNYYKKFGKKRDLEQYFSLSTAQSEIRDPTSLFWRNMKSQSDSDSGEKRSESSNEICRISIKCFAPDTEPSSSQDDNNEKEESQSPPIIMEDVNDVSRNLDDSVKSDEDDHKYMDAALDTSTNKPFSPTSSITSQRKLEWDSLADVGYGNETDRKASGSSLSTLERLALKQQYSNNDSQQENIGVPTAHSTPQEDDDVKSKVKGKTTKLYNRDIERVEVKIPHSSTSNPTQAINVNLTKHISFNVDHGGGVTVDNVHKDVSIKPTKVSVETEVTPQVKLDKEIQTSLTKSRDKSSSSGDLTNNAPTYGRVLISLNSLKKRHRRKKLKNVQRIFRSRRRVVAGKENIPREEKSGEQVSEAESFEYMPGHIYNQNQRMHLARPSNAAGNKSSLESSGVLTTDSSKTSKASFTRDLEKSVSLLKLTLKNHEDSDLKQKLIKAIVQRLIKSTYRGEESSTEFLSGLSFNNKLLGLSESNPTTSSTSDANTTGEKVTKPKKSILRHDKFNPSAIASSSQSAPNLPSVSNSEKPVTTNLVKQLPSSNTDSDISSKEKTSSDNAFAKTSSEELYQKYIDALTREDSYKRHLRDKEMFLKQKLVSSDSMLKLPANLDAKSQVKLKDIIKDLTRNNYDDGSGDASKLEGGSNGNLARLGSGRKLRSHSVFTLSSGDSEYHNRKGARYNDPGDANKPGSSRANQWYNQPSANPHMDFADSSIQVNFDSKPSSSRINPLRSDYKESKCSQTNLDLRQNDMASTSCSSKNAPPSRGKPKTKPNNNILIHEATRSIQTEMSINPKISDPSLHDIRIIGDEDCVKLISEHYREKSKSTIPTTDQQDNADDYTESVLSDGGTSGYNFRLASSAPTEIEPNPDNFAIPIQGTNMTLMVSLNSNPVKIPSQIPNEKITQGTATEKPNETPKGVQANISPRNYLFTKPLVNTLFTRQNFLNEIYPNNEPFDNLPQNPKKTCNIITCPKVKTCTRQTSTDTSENEFICKNKPCTDRKCFNKSSCSDNTCHIQNECEQYLCEPIKFDMGTNTNTQFVPIKPSYTSSICRTVPPTFAPTPIPKSTCGTANPNVYLKTSEPPSPKKTSAGTCTESPKRPVTQAYEPPEMPSTKKTCAATFTESLRNPPENPKKTSAGTCTESPKIPVTQAYEPPEMPSNKNTCAATSTENLRKPAENPKKNSAGTCTESPKRPVTQAYEPLEMPSNKKTCAATSTESLRKPPENPKKSSAGTWLDSPRNPVRRVYKTAEISSSEKSNVGSCTSQMKRPESPKTSYASTCTESPRKPKISSTGCQSSGIQTEKPSCTPRIKYNEECECPETSKCKEGPCGCKKEVPKVSPRVKYNEECECPETSKCKEGPCGCKKEVLKGSPRVKYNEECECPETSKCKEGPCGCKKEVPKVSPRVKYNEECECPETSKCKEGPCGCKQEVPKASQDNVCSKPAPRVVHNENCECPESSKCKDGPCNCIKVIPVTSKCNTYPKEIKITSRNLSVRPNTLPSGCSVPKSIEIKSPRLQFKDYLNRLKQFDVPESCSQAQGSRYQSCDTDNTESSTSKDLIMEMIQDITKRYSKKDVAKSQRKKCFKEIMTILNYLLDTDESPDAEQLKVLMSTTTTQEGETGAEKGAVCFCCRKRKASSTKTETSSSKCTECGCDMTSEKDVSGSDCKPNGLTKTFRRQEVAYSLNVEADCACGALFKNNEVCTCQKKVCVDKGVQLSNRKFKSCDVKKSESSDPASSDLPFTSSDSATCKVLNKIKKECERYQQRRCMSHHSCKKCDASSSTSVNCDCCKCKRVHHCLCKSHKCRGHRHKTDRHKKKCVAYNLIIQTSESMISEEPSQDNCQPLKNVVVKVPPSQYCLNMPFKELANKIEDRIPGSPRIQSKAQRSRSLPNDSISSNDDNMNRVNAYSVREYLERNRPDFVEHSSRRQNCLKMMSESRASEQAAKFKLLSMQLQMDNTSPLMALSEADLRRLAKELGIDSRRKKVPPKFISERDMKRHSERIYKSLPEVVRKKEEAKKVNIKKTNLLMANIFKKNLQKKTLSGALNLPNYSKVVKI